MPVSAIPPRARHLRALKHTAIALPIYLAARFVGMRLWHKNPPVPEVLVEAAIVVALVYWGTFARSQTTSDSGDR